MNLKLTLPSIRLPLGRLKSFDWASLLFHEQKVGGLAIGEGGISLTFLASPQKGAAASLLPPLAQREVGLSPGVIQQGTLRDKDALLNALKEVESGLKLPSRSVIVSLPAFVAQPFIFEFFPHLRPDEITNAIEVIIDSSLPLEREKIYPDWEEIKADDFKKRKFLLAMGIKEFIDPYLEVVRLAGLIPIACETVGWSLGRTLDLKGKPTLVLEFEPSGLNFFVYQNNTFVFQFNLPREVAKAGDKIGVSASQPAVKLTVESSVIPGEPSQAAILKKPAKKVKTEPMQSATPQEQTFSSARGFLEQAAILTKNILHFLLADSEYGFDVEAILLLAGKEDREGFLQAFDSEKRALVVAEPIEASSVKLAALGAARRGLLSRREDTISSLMAIGTELAYERQRFVSFLWFWQKLIIGLGIFFIALFAGTLILVNILSRNFVKALSQEELLIPTELQLIKETSQNFNNQVGRLTALIRGAPQWERAFAEVDKLFNPGVVVNSIDLSLDNPGNFAGLAKNRESLLQLRAAFRDSSLFAPVTLPLAALIARENISFSVPLNIKDKSIFYPK